MQKIDGLLIDYSAYHRTKGNKICHFIGVPLIIFGILSMLRAWNLSLFTGAEALILLSFVYYLTLDFRLALSMLLMTFLLDFVAIVTGTPLVGLGAFVIGWIFQAIGHAAFEKKSPAFLRNLVHLMVGPIFLLNEVLHARPVQLTTG
jgi:uncharacterized membrane protein YGL010W